MSKRANKNTNNQAEDEDDGEIPQEYLRNTQDKGERLRIRTGYRTLIEDLNNKKHELVNPENNTLTEALEVANTLNKDVRTPREGALDSTAILTISSLARQQADNLNTDFVRFEPIEFAEKLVAFIQRENNAPSDSHSRISPDGWKNLGAAGQKLFSKNPPFHFMAGSFDRDVKERPQRNPNVKKNTDKETIDKETIPKKMQSFDGSGGKNEATTAEVERVLDILQKLYKQTDENPICFFEFVLNPESFGQTIENIFYTSFLIKVTKWACSLCQHGDKDLFVAVRKTVVRRHLIEQHSGVSHRCDSCFKFLGRADQKHGTCDARTQTTTLVVRQSGLTGEEAKKVLIDFRQTVDDKILARLLPRRTVVPGQKGKKRPSSEPGLSKTKKWQGQVIATTSPLARVAPPNPPSYVTSRTLGGKHISVTLASSRPRPTPCRVTATVVREPSPTPIEAEEPANSVSGDTALNPSLASDVEDGEVVDQVSIGVGPQETLEVPSIPLPSIRVEEPTPQSPAVTPRPTQDRAEAAPAIEPARRVVWDHLASQRVTDVKLAAWSDVQSGRVVLDIGGTRFVTSKATLKMEPSSLLAEMVQEGSTMRPFRKDEHGSPMYFLDRDPAHFRHILNYLRLGSQWSSQSLPRVVRYLYDLRAETDHFQLQGLHDHINRRITTLIESEYDVNL